MGKCARIIYSAIINTRFEQLNEARESAFINYFKTREVEKRVKISTGENIIPYNGFSFYKIEYKGGFPEYLVKAYQQMNYLNNEAPRKKFKQSRKKNESAIKKQALNKM